MNCRSEGSLASGHISSFFRFATPSSIKGMCRMNSNELSILFFSMPIIYHSEFSDAKILQKNDILGIFYYKKQKMHQNNWFFQYFTLYLRSNLISLSNGRTKSNQSDAG